MTSIGFSPPGRSRSTIILLDFFDARQFFSVNLLKLASDRIIYETIVTIGYQCSVTFDNDRILPPYILVIFKSSAYN
jgi:hypothetical protein